MRLSVWSRGMIPALGAGGPGFNPRHGPSKLLFAAIIRHFAPFFAPFQARSNIEGVHACKAQAMEASLLIASKTSAKVLADANEDDRTIKMNILLIDLDLGDKN